VSRIESALRAAYERARGHSLPDNVPFGRLSALAVEKAADAARGRALAWRLRSHDGRLFVAPGVRLRSPGQISCGRDVVLNRRVVLDGFGHRGITIGARSTIGEGARVLVSGVIREPGDGILIGEDVSIGMDCLLWGQGGITVGSGTLVGPGVQMFSENHVTADKSVPIRLQGTVRTAVRIGSDCWIGARSVVLAGVSIGSGSVVAAGAVVTRDVPSGSIVAGVPARVVGVRGPLR
jgi:acetyltransferase-like isoleucine patch superfamily enzyme